MDTFIATSGQKHLFSFFHPDNLSTTSNQLIITDKQLCQRILLITRLKAGDQCLLFSKTEHLLATIIDYDEKKQSRIRFKCSNIKKNEFLTPQITLYIGLAKKNNWPEILYAAAQLGITTIQPIITERAKTELPTEKRMLQIMISACEQAKQYMLPKVEQPISLDKILSTDADEQRWYADPQGARLLQANFLKKKIKSCSVAIGPEAGFTDKDSIILEQKDFIPYQLTPTVLRTIDAAPLALGIIRTFCKR